MATIGNLIVNLEARTAAFEKALRKARQRTSAFERGIHRMGKMAGRALKVAGTAAAGLAAVTLKAWAEQEKQEKLLDAALKGVGASIEKHGRRLRDLASHYQRLTTFGDEANLKIMRQGLNLGVAAGELDRYTRMVIGLATALDMNLRQAMRYTAVALQGEFTMLRRYIPALRATEDATEQMALVQQTANRGWRQAQAETETMAGRLKQLANRIGDLGERIGKALAPAFEKLLGYVELLAGRMERMGQAKIQQGIGAVQKALLGLGGAWLAPKLVGGFKLVIGVFTALTGASTVLASGLLAIPAAAAAAVAGLKVYAWWVEKTAEAELAATGARLKQHGTLVDQSKKLRASLGVDFQAGRTPARRAAAVGKAVGGFGATRAEISRQAEAVRGLIDNQERQIDVLRRQAKADRAAGRATGSTAQVIQRSKREAESYRVTLKALERQLAGMDAASKRVNESIAALAKLFGKGAAEKVKGLYGDLLEKLVEAGKMKPWQAAARREFSVLQARRWEKRAAAGEMPDWWRVAIERGLNPEQLTKWVGSPPAAKGLGGIDPIEAIEMLKHMARLRAEPAPAATTDIAAMNRRRMQQERETGRRMERTARIGGLRERIGGIRERLGRLWSGRLGTGMEITGGRSQARGLAMAGKRVNQQIRDKLQDQLEVAREQLEVLREGQVARAG